MSQSRFLSRISYLPSYVFLRTRRSFTARKLYAYLEKFYVFPAIHLSREISYVFLAKRLSREILMFFLQNAYLEKFLCFSCFVWLSLCFRSSMYFMINSFWKQGRPRLGYIWIWSMLNMKSASREQSLLPLPDFSRKIEGDSACRVMALELYLHKTKHDSINDSSILPS